MASWRPLLDGEELARARRVARAIADALPPPEAIRPASLDGLAAAALIQHAFGEAERAREYLEAAVAAAAAAPELGPGLFQGSAGIAWVADRLGVELGLDEPLLELLGAPSWSGEVDLISGLAGWCVYLAPRAGRPAARACLERIVEHLASLATRDEAGVRWWTPPDRSVEPAGDGRVNLGVAHGVPGILGALALCCRAGAGGERARALAEGAAAWLLSQERGPEEDSAFGSYAGGGGARSAWCYGDPGIAASLLAAATHAGIGWLIQPSLRIAGRSVRRARERTRVTGPSLCHGAAGLGHLYNRLYQATGEAWLAEAARGWLLASLDAVAGVASPDPAAADLLDGAGGVALALEAATSAHAPTWDAPLLVATPPG